MKTVLATINSKYIHTSLAIRLLYVANKDKYDMVFREYTLKESPHVIADAIIKENPDILGLSVYIWNVKQTFELIKIIRKAKSDMVIFLGGPEVSYDTDFFISEWEVDYVIKGEGEFVIGDLLSAIENGDRKPIKGVTSREYRDDVVVRADLKMLEKQPSPYMLVEDLPDLPNRIVYFESSRGCPYQCSYCLSSLETGVRYFSKDYIRKNLLYLIHSGARLIKFLDRTFNINKDHTRFIFDLLIENYRPGLVCQFEIYADILDREIIDYLNKNLPAGYFRFEIGVQSTYEPTNEAVKRHQDFSLLAENVRQIMEGGKIDLHMDLIAGLPHENFERFSKSFNDVFALGAKELQLGFLKLLRGTALRKSAGQYGYRYNPEAPYEIEETHVLTSPELERIHEAEHALEKFWNSGRFPETMNNLIRHHYHQNHFKLFDDIGQFYRNNKYPHRGYQLEDLFRCLNHFLNEKGIDLFPLLRRDYYRNFKIRPHGFWQPELDKSYKKKLLDAIIRDKEFLKANHLTPYMIKKQTALDPDGQDKYLLTIFVPEKKNGPLFLHYTFPENSVILL